MIGTQDSMKDQPNPEPPSDKSKLGSRADLEVGITTLLRYQKILSDFYQKNKKGVKRVVVVRSGSACLYFAALRTNICYLQWVCGDLERLTQYLANELEQNPDLIREQKAILKQQLERKLAKLQQEAAALKRAKNRWESRLNFLKKISKVLRIQRGGDQII